MKLTRMVERGAIFAVRILNLLGYSCSSNLRKLFIPGHKAMKVRNPVSVKRSDSPYTHSAR